MLPVSHRGSGFYIDGLTLTMMFVITGVGLLIHIYSALFMFDDADYSRFFSYMNLFVSAMLVLVLADNLLLLFVGWEGVGLCSYLLVGFWHEDAANGAAARKAFIVTRVGDTAMALGMFLLFLHLGTLDIQALTDQAQLTWQVGDPLVTIACLLIVGGAVGKSAQLPLQTWLPDAMAGPTPVSALIHAATMVTAGVYLIARLHELFLLAPIALNVVAVIGAVTLLMAAFTALVQRDIKRILAYSTISQIGYMFLALGVGAWSAGIFHLMTHAFFKALLFLGAGAVIYSLHHEHRYLQNGWAAKKAARRLLEFFDRQRSTDGFAFYLRILFKGCHPANRIRGCLVRAGIVGGGSAWRISDLCLQFQAGVSGIFWRGQNRAGCACRVADGRAPVNFVFTLAFGRLADSTGTLGIPRGGEPGPYRVDSDGHDGGTHCRRPDRRVAVPLAPH